MKTFAQLSPTPISLAVAASLVLFTGGTYAAGPAGGGVVGGAHGTSGAVMGPSAAGVSGAGISGAGRGGFSPARAGAFGAQPGVTFSNNAGRSVNGGLARGGGFRANGASSLLSQPYRNVLNPGIAPALSSRAVTGRATAGPAFTRPANTWSGTAVNPSNGLAGSRNPSRPSYRANNNWTANGFTGQRLNPGAPGSNLPSYNQGDLGGRGGRGGNSQYRLPGRYYYYSPYAYGPAYAPYINYFGGYYGAAYPFYNDVPLADTQFSTGATTVSPQYVEQVPAAPDDHPQDTTPASASPAPQRQEQGDANQGTIPHNGPDSLVEAVQDELVRRGYYGGKVDAMFSPETKEALRKFQADRHLAASGLINEATLHALQLD